MNQSLRRETSLTRTYLAVAALLVPFFVLLVLISRSSPSPVDNLSVLPPIFVLVILTVVVLVLAAVIRNASVILGKVSIRYYETYKGEDFPAEWIERPARTFDNLLQVPMLFYVVCLLMMVLEEIDSIQVNLAWLFVGTRIAHAFVYIVFNRVPYRFAAFLAGVLTLAVIWTRFASAVA